MNLTAYAQAGSDRRTDVRVAADASPAVASEARMRELHDVHAAPLRRFLLRLTLGNHDGAEELLQETLLRAWRNLDRLPTDTESVRRWLFTVARHLAIDAARSRKRRPTEVTTVDLNHLAATREHTETVIAVHTIRGALPKLALHHRAVLVVLYYRGFSTAEAAAALGIPEGTVKSRAHHALRALRALVDGD
ncbi:sigma-70 family RNA polymerase sigma factor [Micromonospora sp. NPDC093277]|uniref:sigma-70 family RNA polymerase sigma factor n=1 Tax=Micromonospora sp. NPDC093277 TaxID=3364291 RepID=UPI00382AD129